MSSYQSGSSMCNQKGGGSFPLRYYDSDTNIRQTGGSFSTLANAVGPANYPDNGTMNGNDLFRAFNQNDPYIPASQINQASVLTDGISGTKLTGGAKKKAPAKKKASTKKKAPAKKTTATKKKAPVKKTTATKKKAPVKKTTAAKKKAPVKKALVKKITVTKKKAPVKKKTTKKKVVKKEKSIFDLLF